MLSKTATSAKSESSAHDLTPHMPTGNQGSIDQVKHMLALVGRPLATLHRLAFGNLVTAEDDEDDGGEAGTGARLRVGMCRELSEAEVSALYARAGGQQPEPEPEPEPEPDVPIDPKWAEVDASDARGDWDLDLHEDLLSSSDEEPEPEPA